MYQTANINGLLEIMKSLQGERTQTEFAQQLGVSTSYLSDVYNMRRDPGTKMLRTMGVETVTNYVIPETTINAALTTSIGGQNASKENSAKEDHKEVKASRRKKR
jgi:transcriptional regulator with XRE-family HTH domain